MQLASQIPWDTYIKGRSAKLDELMIANAMPIGEGQPVPVIVRDFCSIQVLGDALRFVGKTDVDISEELERCRQDLRELWVKGKPLRAKEATPATNTAVSGFRLSGSAAEPRGWVRTIGGVEVL